MQQDQPSRLFACLQNVTSRLPFCRASDLAFQKCRYNVDYEEAMGLQTKERQGLVGRVVSKRQAEGQGASHEGVGQHFCYIKYTQLNSDVFTSVIDIDWQQMIEEYRSRKQTEGLWEVSIYEVMLTLRHLHGLVGPSSSKAITQQLLD